MGGTELLTVLYLITASIVGSKQRGKADLGSICYQFHPLVGRSGQGQSVKLGPVQNVKLEPIERGICFPFAGTRKPVTHSTLRQSSAFICAAALVSFVIASLSFCTCFL